MPFNCGLLLSSSFTQPAIICSQLTIKTPERRRWRRYDASIINFEQVSDSSVLLTLCKKSTRTSDYCYAFPEAHLITSQTSKAEVCSKNVTS